MIATYELTQGGTLDRFGTPGPKNFSIDGSGSKGIDPFADTNFPGTSDRTPDSVVEFDPPGAGFTVIAAAFKAGAKKVISRFHARDFLVKDGKAVIAATGVDIAWTLDDAKQVDTGAPAGVQTAMPIVAASSLPADLAAVLHEKFPGFKDLK